MSCIKCGKDTLGQDVFCKECLEVMADYPVKPGTPVLIPDQTSVRRHPTRKLRALEPEEIIRRQRRLIRLLCVTVAVLLVAWALSTAMLIRSLMDNNTLPLGQNFGFTAIDDTGK